MGQAEAQPDLKQEFLVRAGAKITQCRLNSELGKMQEAVPHAPRRRCPKSSPVRVLKGNTLLSG